MSTNELMKMDTIKIIRRICLPSRYLDNNLKLHLLRELSETTKEECSKDYGYILSVKSISQIISHKIGRANSDNVFTVEFEANTLNPKPGVEVFGNVCMIYKDGIFINIMGKQKMLIPATSMINKEGIFEESTGSYRVSGKTIKVGDEITALITASQYNNGFFSCLGVLKDL